MQLSNVYVIRVSRCEYETGTRLRKTDGKVWPAEVRLLRSLEFASAIRSPPSSPLPPPRTIYPRCAKRYGTEWRIEIDIEIRGEINTDTSVPLLEVTGGAVGHRFKVTNIECRRHYNMIIRIDDPSMNNGVDRWNRARYVTLSILPRYDKQSLLLLLLLSFFFYDNNLKSLHRFSRDRARYRNEGFLSERRKLN